MPRIAGGCLCGRIRYCGEFEFLRMVGCHCRDCQRFTGSAFLPVFAVPKGALSLIGEFQTYTQPGGTTGMPLHRVFCPACGSSVMMYRDDTGRINVAAGTLDNPSLFKPAAHIYCEAKQRWFSLSPDVRAYPARDE